MWKTPILEIAPVISCITVTLSVHLRQRKVDGRGNDGFKWCGCQSLLLAKWCWDEGEAAQPMSRLRLHFPGQGKRSLEKDRMAVVIKSQHDNHLLPFCWSTDILRIVCQDNLIQDLAVLDVLWQPLSEGTPGASGYCHMWNMALQAPRRLIFLCTAVLRSGVGRPNISGQMRVLTKLQLSESLCRSKIKLCILIRTVYIHC